jgi:hypothetical protein
MLLHAVVDSIEIVNKARNDELPLSDSNVLLRVSHDSVPRWQMHPRAPGRAVVVKI